MPALHVVTPAVHIEPEQQGCVSPPQVPQLLAAQVAPFMHIVP